MRMYVAPTSLCSTWVHAIGCSSLGWTNFWHIKHSLQVAGACRTEAGSQSKELPGLPDFHTLNSMDSCQNRPQGQKKFFAKVPTCCHRIENKQADNITFSSCTAPIIPSPYPSFYKLQCSKKKSLTCEDLPGYETWAEGKNIGVLIWASGAGYKARIRPSDCG